MLHINSGKLTFLHYKDFENERHQFYSDASRSIFFQFVQVFNHALELHSIRINRYSSRDKRASNLRHFTIVPQFSSRTLYEVNEASL